jgi:hypothetical protein
MLGDQGGCIADEAHKESHKKETGDAAAQGRVHVEGAQARKEKAIREGHGRIATERDDHGEGDRHHFLDAAGRVGVVLGLGHGARQP